MNISFSIEIFISKGIVLMQMILFINLYPPKFVFNSFNKCTITKYKQ